MKNDTKQGVFKTPDFYLACFLYTKNFHIIRTEKLHKDRVSFIFEDRPERQELLSKYYNNNADIRVLDYVNAINALKSIIFNLKD